MIRNRLTPLEYDPGSVVYEHVRRIVEGQVRKASRMGYDPLEAASAANLGYARALATYTDEYGDFVKWVKVKVKHAIQDTCRRHGARWRKSVQPDQEEIAFDPPDPHIDSDPPPEFDLTAALLGMSDDAKAWVSLVLDPPQPVLDTAKRLGWDSNRPVPGIEAAKYRQAVYSFLRDSGWSNRRIDSAYKEAVEALGGKS